MTVLAGPTVGPMAPPMATEAQRHDPRSPSLVLLVRFLAALVLLGGVADPGLGQEGEPRPLTLDDLLMQQRLSSPFGGEVVAISPDGEKLAYSLQRPSLLRGPESNLGGNDRADLWVAGGTKGEPRRITDGSAGHHGYWAPRWSLDGQHLALLSNRAGDIHVYVWDRATGELTRPSRRGTDPAISTDPVWISGSRLLLPVLPPDRPSPSLMLGRRTPEIATEAWSRVVDGRGVTSSTLESGVPTDPEIRPEAQLLAHDVGSGETWAIFEGTVRDLLPSPDREVVAGLVVEELHPPSAGEPLPLPFPAGSRGLEIRLFDAEGIVRAEALTTVRDVIPGSLRWAPDGKKLAFAGTAKAAGDTMERGSAIFVYSLTTGTLSRAIHGELSLVMPVGPFGATPPRIQWTADGRLVVFAREDEGGRPDWWVIEETGELRNLSATLPSAPGQLHRTASAGSWVGLIDGDLWRIPEALGDPTNLTSGVSDPIAEIAWLDPEAARTHGISEVVVRTNPQAGRATLLRVALMGENRIEPVPSPRPGATFIGHTSEGGAAIFTLDDRTGLFLWTVAPDVSEPRTLVEANRFLEEIEEPEARPFAYESLAGDSLSAWLLLPPTGAPNLDRGRGLPVVTWVYAGNMARPDRPDRQASVTYRGPDNLQLLTSEGYAVLIPSMPLSPPHRPGDPYEALPDGVLPALDRAIELGVVDPDRIAVMGASFGGYSTLGLITQTDRFHAAVSVAGASNLVSLYGQFDARFRYEAFPHEEPGAMLLAELFQLRMGAPPWEDMDRYVRNSPITYVDRVETPLLLIQGDLDFVAIQQGEEFFSALYRQGKRARFVRYWGEGHGVGSTANAGDMWEQVFAWLDMHLNGGDA